MPTLLAVDDSREVLAARSAVFGYAGFNVITCDDPRKALARLEKSDVDLVLTDYNMPRVDGLCFAKQARANGYEGPIVMSTAANDLCQFGLEWINQVILKGSAPESLMNAVCDYFPARQNASVGSGISSMRSSPCAA